MEYISRFRRTNSAYDVYGLKHIPRPPGGFSSIGKPKVIFITGELSDIYASLARRGWLDEHGTKLGSVSCVMLGGRWQRFEFLRMHLDRTRSGVPLMN
jgi:hypothetical protein